MRRRAVVPVILAAGLAAGCAPPVDSEEAAADRPSLAVAFFPLADAASALAGDAVEVVDLTPPGVSPHDVEMTPSQRADLERADAVAYLGAGFQPEIEQVVAELGDEVAAVDVLGVVELVPVTAPLPGVRGEVDGEVLAGGLDPHAWLSPPMFAQMVGRLSEVLVTLAPDARAPIVAAREAYLADLAALDAEFASRLSGCASTALVTSHRAFEYLAREYGLTQIPIAGLSGDEEPDPRTLEAITAAARAERVGTVFFEETLPPGLARTVAEEIGAGTAVLDAVETIARADVDAGASYLTVQRENLGALADGLRCGG